MASVQLSLFHRQAGRICAVEDCSNPLRSRDWCERHYKSWWRYGDPLAASRKQAPPADGICSYDGCDRPHCAKGLCRPHYVLQWRDEPLRPILPKWLPAPKGDPALYTKVCRGCGATKALTAFHMKPNGHLGRWHICKACRADKHADHYRNNRDKYKTYRYQYRARRRSAQGCHSFEERHARIAFFGGRCWMCGGKNDAMDHVIPLSRGGSNWAANLRPSCHGCNSRKHSKRLPLTQQRRLLQRHLPRPAFPLP